jgi:hypothetical protein
MALCGLHSDFNRLQKEPIKEFFYEPDMDIIDLKVGLKSGDFPA